MRSTCHGEFQVEDLVLILKEGETPVQGVIVDIVSDKIAKVRTTCGVRSMFISSLRLIDVHEDEQNRETVSGGQLNDEHLL